MQAKVSFILFIIIGFISTAQNSTVGTIKTSISIQPTLTLVDLNDTHFNLTTFFSKFDTFQYNKGLKTQPDGFNMFVSYTEVVPENFRVLQPSKLKRSFFRDFNSAYKRSQLQRLLPRLPDISDFTPCF